MADSVAPQQRGRAAIGRQIVLPFSKAFEIAWKGIRIRLWRSLITMSGIVLAIAFLMSVWTGSVFTRGLRKVPKAHPLKSLVQGALEAEAIAGGGARVRCAVLASESPAEGGQVRPAAAIRSQLDAREEFEGERALAERAALTEMLTREEARLDSLITVGLPTVLTGEETSAVLREFVREGGFLLIYGGQGAGEKASALRSILPALPESGTVTASGQQIQADPQAVRIPWSRHPEADFMKATPREGAVTLASSRGAGLAWQMKVGKGAVAWYGATGEDASRPEVIGWFVQGVAPGRGRADPATAALSRLVVSGIGRAGESQGMRGVWLVSLSLMVCVVGIANAMLMSVTERFREIGTMKCLGALDKFVVKLFLIESSLQGVVGSVIGATIGFLLAFGRALFTFHVQDVETGKAYWLVLRFFPGWQVLIWGCVALVVGILLSVVAAIYPAIRAARMEPVQAMRVEA